MKIVHILFLSWVTFLFSTFPQLSLASPSGQKIVTAAQVNGTWRDRSSTFKVWALGKQRLQVEFFGIYEYRTAAGPDANTGYGSGIAFIEEDTAVFKPEEGEEDCTIIMTFGEEKLVVRQEGTCPFGHNVTATGKYKKVSSQRPKFGEG
ncbi:hypothetical protein [Thiocapsa marina]|uniref:hypothetical protein n=1 Tax=Thiocapsa marina TaxID=244573 RepID=UPI0011120CE5|nr:hypothetical protein [Thiocapsa marina]